MRTSPSLPASGTPAPQASAGRDLYRAVWRWHFYAGLLVLPLLIWLAVTGALFVFHKEIDAWVHHELKVVEAATTPPRAAGAIVAAALAAQPGQWVRYTAPASATAAAEVAVATPQGQRVVVHVDPYRLTVLGSLPDQGTLGWLIRHLHSFKYFGSFARGFIEMAAGWSLLLVATGLYLWWPRGQRGGVLSGALSVRGRPRQRVFWRDLHAVTGLFVGLALAFLALTGMPWSVLWGAQVNQWANGPNFGYPAGVRVQLPMSGQQLRDTAPPAWSLEHAQLPLSHAPAPHTAHRAHAGPTAQAVPEDLHAAHGGGAAPTGPAVNAIALDDVVHTVQALGMAAGYSVSAPRGPTGVYTASVYLDQVALQRVVHLDQYSGQVLLDMAYADYGWLGRWLEWGINVHLGQEYGVPNQWLLVLVCAATVLLCASGAVMWWKRRPAGGLGVPPLPANTRVLRGLLALLAVGGLLFPLVGLSLVLLWLLDRWLLRRGCFPA